MNLQRDHFYLLFLFISTSNMPDNKIFYKNKNNVKEKEKETCSLEFNKLFVNHKQ